MNGLVLLIVAIAFTLGVLVGLRSAQRSPKSEMNRLNRLATALEVSKPTAEEVFDWRAHLPIT